ncbi:MAG: N-acetyltransferase family protein [Devosiaceae bacterium]|nr:N-acetyltransferase family protein [Devosiaceae bacterium]
MSITSDLELRNYRPADIAAITEIYAHYVTNTVISFDLEAPDTTRMKEKFGIIYRTRQPLVVATIEGKLVGYAYASTFRTRPAYRFTCENAIYLAPDKTGLGLGSKLMHELLARSRQYGFNQMIAIVTDGGNGYESVSAGSLALHKKFGFDLLGTFPEVGYKFDTWHGVMHLQKKL